tara:strand:+ start:2722 stop:3537 length:816 start_codon:yes stop_codon:yes gene_type:complete
MELCETSKGYELLTQKIYKSILESEGVENLEVKHDQRVKGKSGVEHQIDVFWEYKYAGVSHKVLIECKYYSKPISLIHARNMLGLLNDIPNSQGLIVTTQGFQSGVIDFCNHYEISLKRIRPPQGSDWDGCIQIVNINGELYQNQYLNLGFSFDVSDEDTKVFFDANGKEISFNAYDSMIEDCGEELFIGKWLDKNITANLQELNTKREDLLEPNNARVILPSGEKLKLCNVNVLWELTKQDLSISVDAIDFVHAVLEDFGSGKVEYTLNK